MREKAVHSLWKVNEHSGQVCWKFLACESSSSYQSAHCLNTELPSSFSSVKLPPAKLFIQKLQ